MKKKASTKLLLLNLLVYLAVVSICTLVSVLTTGNWLPGLPIGVLLALAMQLLIARSYRHHKGG